MISNDKVPFELVQRSQNLGSISKRINSLMIIGLIMFFSILMPSLVNTFEKILLNVAIYNLRKDFTERMLDFIKVVDSITAEENIGMYELSVDLKKNDRRIYSHKHNLNSNKNTYLRVILYPDEWDYGNNQYLEIQCNKCDKSKLSRLDSLLTIEYEKDLKYTVQDISRQYYNYKIVPKPDFSLSGVNIKNTILPIILLVLSLLAYHFSKDFVLENEKFERASSDFLKNGKKPKQKKRIIESLKPNLLADSYKIYYIYPFSRRIIIFISILYIIVCIVWPLHIRVIDYKGPSIIYLDGLAINSFFESILVIISLIIFRKTIKKAEMPAHNNV